MRLFLLAAAIGAVALPSAPAAAQFYSYYPRDSYRDYNRDIRQAQRECRRDLRRADTRREYRRELRDCRRDLAEARRGFRGDWRDGRRWSGPPYGNAWGYRANRGYYDPYRTMRYWDGYRWRYTR